MDSGIRARVESVRERMQRACQRVGRAEESVGLVAVSKMYPAEFVAEAAAAGCDCFGESRVHEALPKIDACPGSLEWHFIGHLQRNKVPPVVSAFALIHAVDSLRLLQRIDACAELSGLRMPVCLEVNVSGESSKFGLAPDEVPAALDAANTLLHVDVQGLMTMAPFSPDPAAARPFFRRLRQLRDQWAVQSGFALETLSMGMSNDFEIAIEEGSTLVRVGTDVFGARFHDEGGAE
ncbi:MAG TPA: YggS family pyridoxal phosphate-dependent enzyme [Verrucomicrobia bacterium]|nr:YggS family pyridoxal phosphate-dependent enzyme [Verrucomicrobiota bacterium]